MEPLWRKRMAKHDESAEHWQALKTERVQRARKKKHAKAPTPEVDLTHTLGNLHSPDETIRARAARELCPCRTDWDVFEQTLDTLRRMTKDPSPVVRANALHVFEDAFELDTESLPTSPQTITNEMAARRRQMRWRRESEESTRQRPRDRRERETSLRGR
jgi:hypothetical protein